MKNTLRITLLTFVLSIIWIILGLTFVSAGPLSYKLGNYFYFAIPYILFLFLPISILLFSPSKRFKILSWIFIGISGLVIIYGLLLYSSVNDFQKDATLFDFIYSIITMVPFIPMYLFIMLGAST
ncbi:hypothetical protein KKA15_01480 [Patescibacteria group bacterium]|nr:hypothetical protein [Patescibacteria group bacterium]